MTVCRRVLLEVRSHLIVSTALEEVLDRGNDRAGGVHAPCIEDVTHLLCFQVKAERLPEPKWLKTFAALAATFLDLSETVHDGLCYLFHNVTINCHDASPVSC